MIFVYLLLGFCFGIGTGISLYGYHQALKSLSTDKKR